MALCAVLQLSATYVYQQQLCNDLVLAASVLPPMLSWSAQHQCMLAGSFSV